MIKKLLKFSLILCVVSATSVLGSDLIPAHDSIEVVPVHVVKKDMYCSSYKLLDAYQGVTDHSLKKQIIDQLAADLSHVRQQKIIAQKKESIGPLEKIIYPASGDRRRPLKDGIAHEDYNFNCYLEIYYANVNGTSKIYYGSGTLVAPNIVLTAGHNLYGLSDGGYPDRIDCFVACYREQAYAQGTVFPNLDLKNPKPSVFIHPRYLEDEAAHHASSMQSEREQEKYTFSSGDIGLIIFDKVLNENYAVPAPHLFEQHSRENILNKSLILTGYPEGERCAYTMQGKTTDFECTQNKICYDIDTRPGQSGSGLCIKNSGEDFHYCVGAHACAGADGDHHNIGVLMGTEVGDKILESIIRLN